MAIIAISGKKNSGKDLIGDIIQYLTFPLDRFQPRYLCKHNNPEDYIGRSSYFIDRPIEEYTKEELFNDKHFLTEIRNFGWKTKKFADKLKDIVCLLIGCTREQLEDEEFKNTELGEEWWKYELYYIGSRTYFSTYLEADEYRSNNNMSSGKIKVIKPTPRFLLQNIGTDLFRNQLHPDIWVNSLMNEYLPSPKPNSTTQWKGSDWIITDLRFPNELKAIKDRDGISIRVNRFTGNSIIDNDTYSVTDYQHPSETALDNAEFDYVIENDGSIEELIKKVKDILIEEKVSVYK